MLFGGDVIFYPGTKVSLENGYLLTLGYWGIVFGGIKIILDLILPISIFKRDVKPIVLLTLCIGCWGCALGNNNSFSFYPLTFLVLATIAFQELKNNKYDGSFNCDCLYEQSEKFVSLFGKYQEIYLRLI